MTLYIARSYYQNLWIVCTTIKTNTSLEQLSGFSILYPAFRSRTRSSWPMVGYGKLPTKCIHMQILKQLIASMISMRHTQCCNFPEHNSKRPDIESTGELSVNDRLNGHPFQRQPPLGSFDIDIIHGDHSWHAKVSDSQALPFSNQDVSTCQVPVDYLEATQVLLFNRYKTHCLSVRSF